MATYKLEVRKQFGSFRFRFSEGSAPTEEVECGSLEDALDLLDAKLADVDPETDSVVFRGIAYDNLAVLAREVKRAPY